MTVGTAPDLYLRLVARPGASLRQDWAAAVHSNALSSQAQDRHRPKDSLPALAAIAARTKSANPASRSFQYLAKRGSVTYRFPKPTCASRGQS